MKYLLSIIIIFVTFAANAQFIERNETVERAGYYTILNYRYYQNEGLVSMDYVQEELNKYQTKMTVGGIGLGLSAASFLTAALINTPVYGVGNDSQANKNENTRYLFKGIGTVTGALGTFFVLDAQKHIKNAKVELGVTSFRIRYNFGL